MYRARGAYPRARATLFNRPTLIRSAHEAPSLSCTGVTIHSKSHEPHLANVCFREANMARSQLECWVEALIVIDNVVTTQHRGEILNLAATHSLPVVSQYRAFAEAGALLAYGPSTSAMYRRAAYYVDRILKGAYAGDLPVEQPTKFDLVINLKTAKALGLTIPSSLLERADEVIE